MKMSQARIAVLIHDDYQELEFWYPVLRFREEGAAVTVVAADGDHTYVSRLGYPVIPDVGVAEAASSAFDAVVVPGAGAAERLAADKRIDQFVAESYARGAVIGALSHATRVLDAAGLLRGLKVAARPEMHADLSKAGAKGSDIAVTKDGRIVTARSPDDLPAFFKALSSAVLGKGG